MNTQTKEVQQMIKDLKHDGLTIIPEIEAMILEISKLDECNYKSGDDVFCTFSILPQPDNSFNVTDSYSGDLGDILHFKYLTSTKQWFDINDRSAISVEGMKEKITKHLRDRIKSHEYYNKLFEMKRDNSLSKFVKLVEEIERVLFDINGSDDSYSFTIALESALLHPRFYIREVFNDCQIGNTFCFDKYKQDFYRLGANESYSEKDVRASIIGNIFSWQEVND